MSSLCPSSSCPFPSAPRVKLLSMPVAVATVAASSLPLPSWASLWTCVGVCCWTSVPLVGRRARRVSVREQPADLRQYRQLERPMKLLLP